MNMFVRSTRNYKEWTINIHILRTKVGPDYFFFFGTEGEGSFLILHTKVGPEIF